MNLANVTAESLATELDIEVPDMYVVLAKHQIMGFDESSLCDILDCDPSDIREVEADPIYKTIRGYIGALFAQNQATRSLGWDGIEAEALEKLAARIPHEKDSDFLLKVAAVANKAQRRGGNDMGLLDPNQHRGTAVTLTRRMVQKITRDTPQGLVEETRELSIRDGSMGRVSFDEVDNLLSVTDRPAIPRAQEISTFRPDPTVEELEEELESRL